MCIKIGYKTIKLWLSDDLKEAIKTKNKLYMAARKNPCLNKENEYII